MHTLDFSPTYPTWALVGGTSRPAGETVNNAQYKVDITCMGFSQKGSQSMFSSHAPTDPQTEEVVHFSST